MALNQDFKINKDLLIKMAAEIGFNLDHNMAAYLEIYAKLLVQWNNVMNLTAITEPDDIVVKHFVDSITLIPFLKDYMKKKNRNAMKLIDVGTGAGFPGMVVAICCPTIAVTLLDSLNKRIGFLDAVKSELRLENVVLIHSRAEDGGRNEQLREKFDVATARAVANLSMLSEFCIPYVKTGGQFIAMKGPSSGDELESAKNGIKLLGGSLPASHTIYIENSSTKEEKLERNIIIIDKIRNTSLEYPRNFGVIKKKPL